MRIELIVVPYHLGHERVGMGLGPDRLVEAGLPEELERAGHEVMRTRVVLAEQPNEIAALFEMAKAVAGRVSAALEQDAFPLVLSGNCFCSLGVVAALGEGTAVVWLDAHPDFNTAEGTTSGFADGMGLAILTGTGWDAMRATIPGYHAVPEEDVVLVGVRDVNPAEEDRLRSSRVARVGASELSAAVAGLASRVSSAYLHLDLDVLDPSEGRANEYAAPGGLSVDEVSKSIEAVADQLSVGAASVTAYDPGFDPDGSLAAKAVGLSVRIVQAAGRPAEVRG